MKSYTSKQQDKIGDMWTSWRSAEIATKCDHYKDEYAHLWTRIQAYLNNPESEEKTNNGNQILR